MFFLFVTLFFFLMQFWSFCRQAMFPKTAQLQEHRSQFSCLISARSCSRGVSTAAPCLQLKHVNSEGRSPNSDMSLEKRRGILLRPINEQHRKYLKRTETGSRVQSRQGFLVFWETVCFIQCVFCKISLLSIDNNQSLRQMWGISCS